MKGEFKMSHNKNYGSYFKKDESKEEASKSYEQKREEVQAPEVAAETAREEAPAEEPKVEEPIMETIKPYKTTAKVIGGKPVNMRFKPNKSGQVINIIPVGALVVVNDDAGEWWKCTYKGITGYMMSQFLKKE